MKSYLWKLALLAGLIWLVILIRPNISPSPSTPPNETRVASPTNPPPVTTAAQEATTLPFSPSSRPTVARPRPITTPFRIPTPPPIIHEVQPGEFPGSIAAGYGISVEALMEINGIDDPTSLQIGQELRIPVTPTSGVTATPLTPQASLTPTSTPIYHTVQAGEVLLSIASAYSITVEAIAIANEISDPRTLQVGQQLLIPPEQGSIPGVPTTIHEIESGDTLLGLAIRYGSTLEDILVSNPDLKAESLQIGQKVIIPLTQPKANSATNPTLPRIESPAEPSAKLIGLEQALFEAVNTQRQVYEMSNLAKDEQLTTVARAHAQDMVMRGYFAHVTPGGITLHDRLRSHGLELNWVGENIQRNTQATEEAAQYAVDWFMGSKPHRDNILNDQFTRIGLGVAEGPPGWYTFVLVFAGDS